ncbi:MAG TPA: HPr(Ser) kinase/phosphatase [Tissierellaceae bacterium]|jgi:HPr kinase/phosphorylase|nr:HPr(Ser) kinase/phosphatase [Tissierellaceae bacterium]
MDYVILKDLIKEMSLEEVYLSADVDRVKIYTTEISRPGLQMAGYYEKFVPDRVQILGSAEWHFLRDMDAEKRYETLDKFLSYPVPVIVVARNHEVFPELLELAIKHGKTIVRGNKTTSKLINDLVINLGLSLAPTATVHGVMMDVFGIGVLITGKSGVGKSETALDLITRGCRLVADDMVEIKRVEDTLRGTCPELIRYFLEIRGVGILDIERLYGVGAVKQFDYIDMVVELEAWEKGKEYDRIGLEEESVEILGISLPKITIPVKPGRNIAMIVEVAAKNNRQKRLGYNAAEELDRRVRRSIEDRRKAFDKRTELE